MVVWPLLSTLIVLPLIGAAAIFVLHGEEATVAKSARYAALWTTLITFAVSLLLWINFNPQNPGFQFVENHPWIGETNFTYHLGVDGISMLFVLLTTFLTPICILASWESIQSRVKEYMITFLVMESTMIGVFCSLDLLLFYLFFEAGLIPMFVIIGVWGGPRRIYATFKFFLYTLLGSVLMLLGILALYFATGTTDIAVLLHTHINPTLQTWLWLAFFASFAVKVPMWPVHTWLPDAHVEAPTAGSVILAGILLKFGAYGFLRFSIPMFPNATATFTPLIFTLSVIAIIYTSLVALMQEDMKKLIAYSSVAHMGFITIGLFTLTLQGIDGGLLQMISHGIVSGALFLCVGVVYDRMHSREIARYGGLVHRMPKYAFVFMLFPFATIGLPATSRFVGEFLTLFGAFQANTLVATLATTGIILGAAYSLWLYRRVIFGALTKADLMNILDLSPREVAIFAPLVIVTLWIGIDPQPFFNVFHASVMQLIHQHQLALASSPRSIMLAAK